MNTLKNIVPFVGILSIVLIGCEKRERSTHQAKPQSSQTTKNYKEGELRNKLIEMQKKAIGAGASPESRARNLGEVARSLESLNADELNELIGTLSSDSSKEATGLLYEAIHKLAKKDGVVALDSVSKLSPAFRTHRFFELVVASNPQGIGQWLLAEKTDDKSRAMSNSVAMSLAKISPDEAYKVLQKTENIGKSQFARTILTELGKIDLYRTIQFAKNLPEAQRIGGLTAALQGGALTDPSHAFDEVSLLKDEKIASGVYPLVFLSWIKEDPRQAGEKLKSLPVESIQQILAGNSGQLENLVKTNPDSAITALDRLVITDANSNTFLRAVREIIKVDPDKAETWVASFPESEKKGDMLKEIVISKVSVDPAGTIPGLINDTSGYRSQILDGVAQVWADKNPSEAINFAKELPVKEQGKYAASVLNATLKRDKSLTASLIAGGSLPITVRENPEYLAAVRSTTIALSSQRAQDSVQWVMGLPEIEREASIGGLASNWAAQDPKNAAEWIQGLPPGNSRDKAVVELIKQIEKSDPENAQAWRNTLSGNKN